MTQENWSVEGYHFLVTPDEVHLDLRLIEKATGRQEYSTLVVTQREILTYLRKMIHRLDAQRLEDRLQDMLF